MADALRTGPDRKWKNVTMYDDMDFPDYEFREFPKAIPVVDGIIQDELYYVYPNGRRVAHPVVIVNDEHELDALKGGNAKLVPTNPDAVSSPLQIENEETIRAELYEQAEVRGVKIDKRWSVERIRAALEAGDVV